MFSGVGGEGRKRAVVKPETIAATGPGEHGERHGASSHCSCRDVRKHLGEQPELRCFPSSPEAAKSP